MSYTHKFGATIYRYHSPEWADEETLDELISFIGYMSDDGLCSYDEEEFYELTKEGWVNIDSAIITELFRERDKELHKKWDAAAAKKETKLWEVIIPYPGVDECWNRFETLEEAQVCLKQLPEELHARIDKKEER